MEGLDPEESEEDTMAYYYVDSLYEKYQGSLGELGASMNVDAGEKMSVGMES